MKKFDFRGYLEGLRVAAASMITPSEPKPEFKRLPDSYALLASREGIIPKVPQWNETVDAILAAHDKCLTGCSVFLHGSHEAESVAFTLKEMGYEAMAYWADGVNKEHRRLDIHWRYKDYRQVKKPVKA